MQLLTPVDLKQSSSHHTCLDETEQWVRNFLGKPHPELGRPGPVCPFVPRALRNNAVYFSAISTQGISVEKLTDLVSNYCSTFLELEPKTGPWAVYKSILLVFPDVTAEQASELIDVVQQKLKPIFVDQGLMIGEFHSRNDSPGLHNPLFRPLRSPIPMLAIRFMAETDLPFLSRTTDDAELRLRYLQAYVRRMRIEDPSRSLGAAEEAIALAEAELAGLNTGEMTSSTTTQVPLAPSISAQGSNRTCPFRPVINFCRSLMQQLQAVTNKFRNLMHWSW